MSAGLRGAYKRCIWLADAHRRRPFDCFISIDEHAKQIVVNATDIRPPHRGDLDAPCTPDHGNWSFTSLSHHRATRAIQGEHTRHAAATWGGANWGSKQTLDRAPGDRSRAGA
jgi:hypothetical protein